MPWPTPAAPESCNCLSAPNACWPPCRTSSGIVALMLAQIRIYTINRGEMDAFLKHFTEQTVPLHQQVGIPIVGMYVNRPQNEFIWVRTFADEQDRDTRIKAFQDAARAGGV